MNERRVTLAELLDSRERRAARQKEILEKYGGLLVSMTLNIPGPIKDRECYRKALETGMKRLSDSIPAEAVNCREQLFLPTGPEGYLSVKEGAMPALELKRLTVQLEEADALGRLFDMDVLTGRGGISRAELNKPGRKCLICGRDAKLCARSQRHSVEELLKKIDEILEGISEQK